MDPIEYGPRVHFQWVHIQRYIKNVPQYIMDPVPFSMWIHSLPDIGYGPPYNMDHHPDQNGVRMNRSVMQVKCKAL